MQTIRFWLKFGSLSPAFTLEIRSRSLKPNQLFFASHCYIHANKIRWFMRCSARKKLSYQRRRDRHLKQYVSLPFGGGGGDMIMQRTIFSPERLCSKPAPKDCTVSLASVLVPLMEEFKADLDKIPDISTSC